jgi:hypothetical protein
MEIAGSVRFPDPADPRSVGERRLWRQIRLIAEASADGEAAPKADL